MGILTPSSSSSSISPAASLDLDRAATIFPSGSAPKPYFVGDIREVAARARHHQRRLDREEERNVSPSGEWDRLRALYESGVESQIFPYEGMTFSSAADSIAAAFKQRRLLKLNSAAGKTEPLHLPAYTLEKPRLSPLRPQCPGPFISVSELILPDQAEEKKVVIPLHEELKFVLVFRDEGSTAPWFPPPPQSFHPAVNRILSTILPEEEACTKVVAWNSLFSDVGLMGLYSSDRAHLTAFRRVLAGVRWDGKEYNTFPMSAVAPSEDLTVVLRTKLLDYDLKDLCQDLCYRNDGLYGTLRAVNVHFYADNDVTKAGESMRKWRMVWLVGDQLFHESLRLFHIKHDFKIGSDFVRVQGGRLERPSGPRSSRFSAGPRVKRARY